MAAAVRVTGKRKAPCAAAPSSKTTAGGARCYSHEAYGLSEDGLMYHTDGKGKLIVYGTRSALEALGGPVQRGPLGSPFIERTATARLGQFLARPYDATSWLLTRCDAPAETIRLHASNTLGFRDYALTTRQREAVRRRGVDHSDHATVVARRTGELFIGVRVAVQNLAVVCYDCSVDATGSSMVRGDHNLVRGNDVIVIGDDNYVIGDHCIVEGFGPVISGRSTRAVFTQGFSRSPAMRVIQEQHAEQLARKDSEIADLRRKNEGWSKDAYRAMGERDALQLDLEKFRLDLERKTASVPPMEPAAAATAITCNICLEWTCDTALSCGHLICSECVKRLPLSAEGKITCPRCRTATKHGMRVFI